MYRHQSPIFDVPEYPPLRRVKPLPKRRRMGTPPDPGTIPPVGPSPTAEELIAHAESLSTHLQYYIPTLDGLPDLFNSASLSDNHLAGNMGDLDLKGYPTSATPPEDGRDEHGEYADLLIQPGNTKKRKVPVNMSGFPMPQDAHGVEHNGGELGRSGWGNGRAIGDGNEAAGVGVYDAWRTPKPVLSRITKAAIQQKQLMKSRKEQMAGVLGLGQPDTLALDQALTTAFPLASLTNGEARIRLSKRNGPRLSRAVRVTDKQTLPPSMSDCRSRLPEGDFTFEFMTSTSDRSISTRHEVTRLHARFEAEIARQAAKATEAAKAAAAAVGKARPKRLERTQARAPTKAITGPGNTTPSIEQSLMGSPGGKKKKKKRSALANASNPHHLRNYVPSRLPHSGQQAATQDTQSSLGPFPLRFLSAELAPGRRSATTGAPTTAPVDPAGEWICPFCEYNLFYGDEQAFRRAIRSRKKVLKRRRRARERAAAAASGKGSAPASRAPEDEEALFETPHDDVPASITSQVKWKSERKYDGDPGGNHR